MKPFNKLSIDELLVICGSIGSSSKFVMLSRFPWHIVVRNIGDIKTVEVSTRKERDTSLSFTESPAASPFAEP